MKRLDIANKAITLLVSISTIYAILDKNWVFLSPILTLVIPYKLMKQKEEKYYNENKKALNSLFLFNLISFTGICLSKKDMSVVIFDLVVNISMAFIYYRIMVTLEKKQENINKNPQIVLDKINQRIQMLEQLSDKMKNDMENTEDEKVKNNLNSKIEVLNQKINQSKSQLEIMKMKINSKDNNIK